MKMIILSLIMAFVLPTAAQAHSGGTNSSGCHKNHKTGGYHCH
ncbi:MAG: YHYH domain-containing protein [Pseudomonadota bacterium]